MIVTVYNCDWTIGKIIEPRLSVEPPNVVLWIFTFGEIPSRMLVQFAGAVKFTGVAVTETPEIGLL